MSRVFRHILPLLSALLLITVFGPALSFGQSIQIAPSPVPTQTPIPTPSPKPTPEPRIVDNFYQSRHGWSISWSTDWKASLSVKGQGSDNSWTDDSLILRHDYLETSIVIQTVGGPVGMCETLVKDNVAAPDAAGEQLKSRPARTDTWIVRVGETGSNLDGVGTYEECHLLGGSIIDQKFIYLSFVATAPSDDFEVASIAFLEISEDLVLD